MRSRTAQRELFDMLDEADRFIVYRSAYSTFKAVNQLIMIGALFFILSSFRYEFSPLPIIVLAVIAIVQKAVYDRKASKAGQKTIDRKRPNTKMPHESAGPHSGSGLFCLQPKYLSRENRRTDGKGAACAAM